MNIQNLVPNFVFRYTTGLPDKSFARELEGKLRKRGGTVIESSAQSFRAEASLFRLLGFPYWGKLVVVVEQGEEGHSISLGFPTDRIVFFLIAGIVSALVVWQSLTKGEYFKLLLVPLILEAGHLVFYLGFLPPKWLKLKRLLFVGS